MGIGDAALRTSARPSYSLVAIADEAKGDVWVEEFEHTWGEW